MQMETAANQGYTNAAEVTSAPGECAIRADVLHFYERSNVDSLELVDTEGEVIQAWEGIINLLRSHTHPTLVWEAGWKALLSTAQVWGVSVEEAIEGVMLKFDFRTTPSRLHNVGDDHPVTPEIASAAWANAKRVTKTHQVPISQMRGFHSIGEAIKTLRDHYRRRRAEQCPRRSETVADAIQGTCGVQGRRKREGERPRSTGNKKLLKRGEIHELIEALRIKGRDSTDEVVDEMGDCLYGLMAYSTAWFEHIQAQAVQEWHHHNIAQAAVQHWLSNAREERELERVAAQQMWEGLRTWHLIMRWRARMHTSISARLDRTAAIKSSKPKATRPVGHVNEAKRNRLRSQVQTALSKSWIEAKARKAARVQVQKQMRHRARLKARQAMRRAEAERPSVATRVCSLGFVHPTPFEPEPAESITAAKFTPKRNAPAWRAARLRLDKNEAVCQRPVHPAWARLSAQVSALGSARKRRRESANLKPKSREMDARLAANRWHSMAITVKVYAKVSRSSRV
jgi:hypothetical protein